MSCSQPPRAGHMHTNHIGTQGITVAETRGEGDAAVSRTCQAWESSGSAGAVWPPRSVRSRSVLGLLGSLRSRHSALTSEGGKGWSGPDIGGGPGPVPGTSVSPGEARGPSASLVSATPSGGVHWWILLLLCSWVLVATLRRPVRIPDGNRLPEEGPDLFLSLSCSV